MKPVTGKLETGKVETGQALSTGPARWVEWAQALLARFARLFRRPAGPRMLFQEPGTLPPARIELHSHNFFVALFSRLQPTFRDASSIPGSRQPLQLLGARAGSGDETSTNGSAPVLSTPLLDRRPAAEGGAENSKFRTVLPRGLAIERIHRRYLESQRLPRSTAPIVSGPAATLGEMVLQRVARAEQPARTRMQMRHPSDPRVATNRAPDREHARETEQQIRTRFDAPDISRMAAPAGVNFDQLTEEVIRRIEDRMRAHRERMGRIF